MSLDMIGHIDDCFQSVPATRTSYTAAGDGYDAIGLPVDGTTTQTPHKVNIQPLTEKEIDSLDIGAERIVDGRKVYVNDGDLYAISPSDTWTFDGVDGTFRSIKTDNRPWRNYCKIIVSRNDED